MILGGMGNQSKFFISIYWFNQYIQVLNYCADLCALGTLIIDFRFDFLSRISIIFLIEGTEISFSKIYFNFIFQYRLDIYFLATAGRESYFIPVTLICRQNSENISHIFRHSICSAKFQILWNRTWLPIFLNKLQLYEKLPTKLEKR